MSWCIAIKNSEDPKGDQILTDVIEMMYVDHKEKAQSLREYVTKSHISNIEKLVIPSEINELIKVVIQGIPRSIKPLKIRRKDTQSIKFDSEYDIQSLLHALLSPWIRDIRTEEYTPSYVGNSTRIDFLLPTYETVIEAKYVRNSQHAKKVGDELLIDIAHYRVHPHCQTLWIAIYDPEQLLQNPDGIANDLQNHTELLTVNCIVIGS